MTTVLFWLFATVSVISAIGVVANVRNTINAALSLVVCMLSLAGLDVMLSAEFVGLIQVMVYAGAIVVLFLFVIMLLNLKSGSMGAESQPLIKILGGAVIGAAAFKLASVLAGSTSGFPELPEGFGSTRSIATVLYTDYLLAFEVAGVLLLAGIVAAVVVGKRTLD